MVKRAAEQLPDQWGERAKEPSKKTERMGEWLKGSLNSYLISGENEQKSRRRETERMGEWSKGPLNGYL
ncbi:hypothetical protein ABU162_10520 [Paenibacillus thiaminolyticus]|uniref:hypothetical protein n=1 Tax=Paenibacillus thiaminolyticus TaxID=49283 RepID=UPI0035A5883B